MIDAFANALSPLGLEILHSNPHAYTDLVHDGPTPAKTRSLLEKVQPDQLFLAPPKSYAMKCAALAGLWLWNDGLEECHRIVQKSPEELRPELFAESSRSLGVIQGTNSSGEDSSSPAMLREYAATLSYWHAIIHRREGDFSNSKYWYARTDGHPVLQVLSRQAGTIVNSQPAEKSLLRIVAHGWNSNALVDLAEAVRERKDDPRYQTAIQLQQLEWKVLFGHCVRG